MTGDMAIIRLSYIVPVYNTSAWLVECMDSILKHEGDDIEFVIIDDGSTDSSGQIVEQYAKSDRRIRVIHQSNGGLSVARNVGLENARGEYILFVDSDDRIKAQAVSDMLVTAMNESADVVVGRIICQNELGDISIWEKFLPQSVFPSGFDFLKAVNFTETYFPMVFGYLVRRSLLKNHYLKFVPRLVHEDELWTPQMLIRAKKIVVSDNYHYFYRTKRNGSIMNTCNTFDRCLSIGQIVRQFTVDIQHLIQDSEDSNYRKAMPFYHKRLSALVAIIENISSSDTGATKLIRDFAVGHYSYFCDRLMGERRRGI